MASDIKNSSLATGLVSYWELEESSGVRTDSHGSNDLTDNNTVGQVAGIQGNAADFVSANSEFLSSTSTDFDFQDTDWSIVMWFNVDSAGVYTPLATKMNTSDYGFQLYVNSGPLEFAVYDGSTGNLGVVSGPTISATTWYHIVVYHDASASQTGMYVNAGTPNTASLSGNVGSSNAQFRLGSRQLSSVYGNLILDEVAVWDKVLSASDVAALYNSGSGIPYEAASGYVTPHFRGFGGI